MSVHKERHSSTLAFPLETHVRGRCHVVAEGVRAVWRAKKTDLPFANSKKKSFGSADALHPLRPSLRCGHLPRSAVEEVSFAQSS